MVKKTLMKLTFNPLYEAGLAYQIQDDLSDFLGIKDRGLPGRDLKEGKMNVLIMHFLETATSGERFLLKEFLQKSQSQYRRMTFLIGLKS